jgi:uncharacterized protein YecT (DUF1311 family)
MSRLIFLVSLTVMLAAGANAASLHGTVCTHNASAHEAETCLQQALRDAQVELKKKYTAVAALLGTKDRKEELARSQKTWGLYVAQTCDGLTKTETVESHLGRADVLSCKTELTIERTSDLDRMFYASLHD